MAKRTWKVCKYSFLTTQLAYLYMSLCFSQNLNVHKYNVIWFHCYLISILFTATVELLFRRLVRKTWNVFSLRFICLLLFIAGVLFLGYLCPSWLCSTLPPIVAVQNDETLIQSWTAVDSYQASHVNLFPPSDLVRKFHFDGDHDILVFLHIQKTGGSTFGRHLVRDAIGVPVPCECQTHRKRCNCTDGRGRQWLFSRYSTGWVCGLHADWTELHECVPSTLDEREGEKRQRRFVLWLP